MQAGDDKNTRGEVGGVIRVGHSTTPSSTVSRVISTVPVLFASMSVCERRQDRCSTTDGTEKKMPTTVWRARKRSKRSEPCYR